MSADDFDRVPPIWAIEPPAGAAFGDQPSFDQRRIPIQTMEQGTRMEDRATSY
jgi:hypothetical protein